MAFAMSGKTEAVLDPEIAAVLEMLKGAPPMDTMEIGALRASMIPMPVAARPPVGSINDIALPGGLAARIYQPVARQCDSLIVFFHGGGFVLGSIETHDHLARGLCIAAGCAVLSLDYRLAPEHRFPAATDDCLLAARWARDNAASLGASSRRIVLAGDSAGGNLATVTTMRLRDGGLPQVSGQLLGYPVADYHTPPTPSYIENASGYSLTRAAMIRFWNDYVSSEAEAFHPHASPLRSTDLSGLPPALILTAQFDPLRDEGEVYAAKLKDSGVPVRLIRYDGLIHGFLRMAAVSARARQSFTEIGEWVRSLPPGA
jgi:acetyl esterase